jgi:hypothetical protein
MTKIEALRLIDEHKNGLVNPVEMLDWVWLRVIIQEIDDDVWGAAVINATTHLSK